MDNWIFILVWIAIGIVVSVLKKKNKAKEGSMHEKNIPNFEETVGDLGEILEEKIRSFRDDIEENSEQSFPTHSQQTKAFQEKESEISSEAYGESAKGLKYTPLTALRQEREALVQENSRIRMKSAYSAIKQGDISSISETKDEENDMQNIAVSDVKELMLTKPQTAFLLSEIFRRPYQ